MDNFHYVISKMELQELDTQIEWLEGEKEDIQCRVDRYADEIHKLKEEKCKILREKYPQVWRIVATPSNKHHTKHSIGCFESEDQARKYITCGSSYDFDDNITWYYTLEKVNSDTIGDINILNMGKRPDDFPYIGR